MTNRITEITRRDIRDALSGANLYGRLGEIEFLCRLYDLDSLSSHDDRFATAREDILQHRFANDDWENGWLFDDDRFGMKNGDDEVFLRFLAELLHPAVRPDQEDVGRVRDALNRLLAPDGYRLAVKDYISGRPVYGAIEIPPEPLTSAVKSKHFTDDVRPVLATIARLAELNGSELEKDVLRLAEPRLEEPEYDNLDGGTYYYTLTLSVPVEVFARLGDQVRSIEERIGDRIKGAFRAPDRHRVTSVVIQPTLVPETRAAITAVLTANSERTVPRFWAPRQFRLFISHVTSFKQRATALRHELSKYHISGFVAHETIDPGELWQREVEAALRSMHGMAALLTPDFHQSNWTDQEIGWALGSGIYVVPVRRGVDPYGFLAEVQGIQGSGKTVSEVAGEIFAALLRVPVTREKLIEATVDAFERSNSYTAARANLGLIVRARPISEALLRRIHGASRSNNQIRNAFGTEEKIDQIISTLPFAESELS